LRAILLAQIESARHRLLSCRVPTEGSIHAVRKTLKRARATLRLLRPSLAEGTFRRANARLRDAAAVLRAARDAKVLLDTVLRLLESEPHSARPLFDGLARMLARERTAADRALLRDGHGVAWGVNVLKDLTAHVQHWRTSRADSACVVAALRRTYKKTRKAAAIAGQQRTDATLHEWRKQLKYLVYELQLLQPLRPKYLGRRLLMARRLAELLGIDHDLAVLRQKVSLKAARAIPRAELSAFVAMLDRRRLAAQMKSYTVGRRLFAQTPRRLVHRLRSRGALARTLTAAYAASRRARSSSRESAGPVFPTT
jgi:CHAD domain-containing protein